MLQFQEHWKTKDVYVVGPATKLAVKEMLGLDSLGEESGNAENLAQFIIQKCVTKEALLFPRGNLAKETLKSVLSIHGFTVDDVICYQTQPCHNIEQHLTKSEIPEYAVLFSPSGAATSLPALKTVFKDEIENIKIVSIGPTTEAEIVNLGFDVYKVLSKPSPEVLLETLEVT